ncbi:hypothetical protein QUF80_12605 [Desulfococcaceae bacterium HSG8]|nr:hypothetical protein [Desulfococcaceae bacterium HSG8]
MDTEIAEHFAAIVDSAQAVFDQLSYRTDITPKRAILNLQGKYGMCRVFVTELFSDDIRKYRYYVLTENRVEAGFDNSPDPRAIRLRHGKIGEEHAGEHIPHLHWKDKTEMTLTEEMTFENFVRWLENNVRGGETKEQVT